MLCTICNGQSYQIFQKDGIWIRVCEKCRHRFAEITPPPDHLDTIYSDKYFSGGDAGYPNYLAEADILIEHGRRYGRILEKFTTPGTLLDVGAASGFILKGLTESGWQGSGLEPNSSMAEYGRTNLGVQIINGSLEQFHLNQQFDLVCMIQVISHFYNIRQALQKAADATKPGGFWLIETWNRESCIARGLGRYWHEYSPPSVLHWFSPEGLNHLASQFGFSEIARGRPVKRLSGSHAKSLLSHKLKNSPLGWLQGGLKIIPDNLVTPYPSCDLFWILLQKSRTL